MDISSLRERRDTAMSVSELNQMIKAMFDSNRLLTSVYVRGEISNFISHRSGHMYFSIKDTDGQIKAVMFYGNASRLKFVPENGMKVIVCGSVSVFPSRGEYQIYVTSMQPDGIGALHLAYEQLKIKLETEGLFSQDHKKPIPIFPSRVGVITSPTGAAVRDIINVIARRSPITSIYLYPVLVQGDGAAADLVKALDYFDRSGLVDTVIIGRGGGSIEDLWAFNDEQLARRIFEAKIPIISAVGHETDFTICDFVADLRAPTPSAAAELAVPDIRDIKSTVAFMADRCDRAFIGMFEKMHTKMDTLRERLALRSPINLICENKDRLAAAKKGVQTAFGIIFDKNKHRYIQMIEKLEALNPLSVLARGYSVVELDGAVINDTEKLKIGDEVKIHFKDGSVNAVVDQIYRKSEDVK